MTWSLVWTLDDLLAGSSRIRPSRLPKMLWPTQLMTLRLRRANIGASTVFMRVSPVLPSLPAWRAPVESASSCRAGNEAPRLGGEWMRGGGVDGAGGQQAGPSVGHRGVERVPVTMDGGHRERRLRAGDVQDDHVADRLGFDERSHIGGDPVHGLAGRPGRL